MCVDVEWTLGDLLDELQVPMEVAYEGLQHNGWGLGLDAMDAGAHMCRTPVDQVISVYHRHHNVLHPHLMHRIGHLDGLLRVQWGWFTTGEDGAEATASGAVGAHDHNRGRGRPIFLATASALTNVRTLRLLTHGGQFLLPHATLYSVEAWSVGHAFGYFQFESGWERLCTTFEWTQRGRRG